MKTRSRPKWSILLWCATPFAAWFFLHTAVVVWTGLGDTVSPADVAVVLGNQVMPDGTPHPRLQGRLDRAAELYRDGKVGRIIVSGGKGPEGFEEAEVMRDALVDSGIPSASITVDRKGANTFETARQAAHFMKCHDLDSAIVVTHYYHILRSRLAFESFGVHPVYTAHARVGPEWREPYSLLREFVGYYYYLLRDYPVISSNAPCPETVTKPAFAKSGRVLVALRKRLLGQFEGFLSDPDAYSGRVQSECSMFPEGDLFPYVFVALAYANLAMDRPEPHPDILSKIATLIELAKKSVVARVKPPAGDLGKLEHYRDHATYLGQFNLALGAYRLVGGDNRFGEIHRKISGALVRALEETGGGPLNSFPNYSWPFDTIPVLVSLKLYDRSSGTSSSEALIEKHLDWIRKNGTHASLGLPYSRLGDQQELPRGCDLSLRLCLLPHIDEASARALYTNYTRHHWIDHGFAAGFAEWPGGIDRYQDADSGPIFMGIGMAATGLGIGATIAMRDQVRIERLAGFLALRDTGLPLLLSGQGDRPKLGGMIPFDPQYFTGFLFGDAILFYTITWKEWTRP